MEYYIDIRLLPDPEFPPPLLMGALFGKFHRALVALKANDIGVSFPGYSQRPRTVGETLRLHGSAAALNGLMTQNWLTGMRDHIVMTTLEKVPASAQHRIIRRRQFKTNAERLRRRRAQRHNETLEEARAHIPDSVERKADLPFITLRSSSTGERFCFFVEQGKNLQEPVPGTFNRYGLSQGATVPWF